MENFTFGRRLRLLLLPLAPVAASTISALVLSSPAPAAGMISSSVRRARSISAPVVRIRSSVRVVRWPLGASPNTPQPIFLRDREVAVRRPALLSSCRRSSSSTARRRGGFTCRRRLTFLFGAAFRFLLVFLPPAPVELFTLALLLIPLARFFITPALLLLSGRRTIRGFFLLVLFQERRTNPSTH